MSTKETITTWADGFGRWHARITFPSGLTRDAYAAPAERTRIRSKVRRAIRREIVARQRHGAFSCYIDVKEESTDAQGVIRSIVYAETER